MKTRFNLLIIVSVFSVMALIPADAAAQNRPQNKQSAPSIRPGVQTFPQVSYSGIQQTMTNMYLNEMSKRAAYSSPIFRPIYVLPNPYAYMYPYGPYGAYPRFSW